MVRECRERADGEVAIIKILRKQSCHYNNLLQGRAPLDSCLWAIRAHGHRKGSTWPLLCFSSLIQHKCIWGFMGFWKLPAKLKARFLGYCFPICFSSFYSITEAPSWDKNVTGTIGRTCSLQACSEGRAAIAGWEPAASIFSPFLLIPDHILTTDSRSQETFTRTLSPSTAHPAGPPEHKPFISLLINANRKTSCSPPSFPNP